MKNRNWQEADHLTMDMRGAEIGTIKDKPPSWGSRPFKSDAQTTQLRCPLKTLLRSDFCRAQYLVAQYSP